MNKNLLKPIDKLVVKNIDVGNCSMREAKRIVELLYKIYVELIYDKKK